MSTKNDRRKALLLAYKDRKVFGGVYKITNTSNNRFWLNTAISVQGDKKRFEFSQKTNSCVFPSLQKDWNEYGAEAFVFEILEEIEIKNTQTTREFKEDLKVLGEIWREKLAQSGETG
ncbi:MAG: GIY-YIG nuclease family protein [Bacillota bacterium]